MPPPKDTNKPPRGQKSVAPARPSKPPPGRFMKLDKDAEAERNARTESDLMGMMLVRVAQAEERAKRAEDSQRALQHAPPVTPPAPDTRIADALAMRVRDLESQLAEMTARLHADAPAALRMSEARLVEVTGKYKEARIRTEKLSNGLAEMRALLADCAGIYEELERRELAIAGIRARSLKDAKELLLRAASGEPGRDPIVPPPLPQVLDVSEVAELIESMRPSSIDEIAREAESLPNGDPGFVHGPLRT